MYLFDTDTLSNIVKRNPSSKLLGKLKNIPKSLQYTTAINIGEIYYGANRSPRKEQLIAAFAGKVFPNVNILSFDGKSGEIFGLLKAELEKHGIGCSEPDLRIASIAIRHNLTLITGNTKHFIKIPGLRVEDWIM
jgi:tRNA(fMet)-specific endonuclease VapC